MAHTYFGKDNLILTDLQKQDFPSGLSRIDLTYKCRTTEADNLAPLLAAGNRAPEYPSYILRENPKRVTGTDGFTTFTATAFYGSLATSPNANNLIPSVLGAQIIDLNYALTNVRNPAYTGNPLSTYQTKISLKIISDTITRTFTMLPSDSVTSLAIPSQTLSFKVISAIDSVAGDVTADSIANFSKNVYKTTDIINVNRSNFGGFDEVQITWGLSFDDSSPRSYYYFL